VSSSARCSAHRDEARRAGRFSDVLQTSLLGVPSRAEELAILAPLVGDQTNDREGDDRDASEDAEADRLKSESKGAVKVSVRAPRPCSRQNCAYEDLELRSGHGSRS